MLTKSFLTGVVLAAGLLMGCGGVETDSAYQERAEAQAAKQAAETGKSTVSVVLTDGENFDDPVRCFVCACKGDVCVCEEVVCPSN